MGANSALIFGIIINVAILLVFFRFLNAIGSGELLITLWCFQPLKPPKL
jgi:hypothetical protein